MGESAWLAVLPCALVLVAAIVLLGPVLARLLLAPPDESTIWYSFVRAGLVRPEPIEQARYFVALLGPLLLAVSVLLLGRRNVRGIGAFALVALSQAALVVFVAACITAQHLHVYEPVFNENREARTVLLTVPTLVTATLLALSTAWALSRAGLVARVSAILRETRLRRAASIGLAAVFILLWLLSAFNTDGTIERAHPAVSGNVPFWSDEAFAILGGHAPLVDFHAQYGHLWAYIAAGGLELFGASLGVYAAIMLAGTTGVLAAALATLRRLAGSWPAALALFLPFVATSFFMEMGPLENRYGPANLFSLFPIRYGGPFVLLWLVVRRVQRGSARPPVALFAFAGLVTINNLEFGLPAFAASLVALAATAADRSPRGLARLGASALVGAAVAVAVVAALTLAVAGSLPHFGMLTVFPRIYGAEGFGMLPMPGLGLHVVLYVTFAATFVVAAIRAASAARDTDPALTTALVWAGIFGLGASGYFLGRSHPHVLIDLFSAWALAISLLLIVVVRTILHRSPRRPQLAELLVLAGFGVAVCSLAQTPTPWSQLDRLSNVKPARIRTAAVVTQVVDSLTRPGEPVALMMLLGHRIAHELGINDVTPYANMESMMTMAQWDETIAALRRAHGRRLIIPLKQLFAERMAYLEKAGYVPLRQASGVELIEWVARRPQKGG